ncbi:MAG: hypothetical protein R3B55_02865 [Candidatus Paceibacterota bacterium]
MKNINSFRAVEKAAKFEIERHIKLLEEGRGDEIVQETRGWDENKEVTFSQRSKENSEDYRYFPEPDLPKVYLHDIFDLDKLREKSSRASVGKERKICVFWFEVRRREVFLSDFEIGRFLKKLQKKFLTKK